MWHHNPQWRVPTTWRTEFNWKSLDLSPPMRRALRTAAPTGLLNAVNSGTVTALHQRYLCKPSGALTDQGRIVAISLCSLRTQCDLLGIPLRQLELSWHGRPEMALMDHLFDAPTRRVSFCEGGAILLTLYCLCFERLYRLGVEHWGGPDGARSFMYSSIICYGYLLQRSPELPQLMLEDIGGASEQELLAAFDIIKSWQYTDTWFPHNWFRVDRELVQAIYEVLGNKTLAQIGRIYLSDPYAFSKGWPDLTVVDPANLRMVETKTTEALHVSQLITIPIMARDAGLAIEVVQLRAPSGATPAKENR